MRILLLDIETSPMTAHVWGLWDQRVGIPQLLDSGRVLCWAAGWHGEDNIIFSSEHMTKHSDMIGAIHGLLDEADAVVHYNGTKFDIPTLNKEFILAGLTPPSPYKQIDLLRVCRQRFRFPSNRLDYVASQLGLGGKVNHEGHMLWVKCMNGDKKAWAKMEEYNIHDVVLLEQVYNILLPWINNHPNWSLYDSEIVCPNCGSKHKRKGGYNRNSQGIYQRYQCLDCSKWYSAGKTQQAKPVDMRSRSIG